MRLSPSSRQAHTHSTTDKARTCPLLCSAHNTEHYTDYTAAVRGAQCERQTHTENTLMSSVITWPRTASNLAGPHMGFRNKNLDRIN